MRRAAMELNDPVKPDKVSGRVWRWIGLATIATVAVLLFGATVWFAQGGGLPGAAGAGTSTPAPAATSTGAPAVSETPIPDETTAEESAPPVDEAPVEEAAEPSVDAPPVDVAPLPELPSVPLTEEVAPVPGIVIGIDGLESVTGEAQGPGEVGGPALRFTLSMRNDGDSPLSLESTVVTVYSGPDQTPAPDLREPGGVPLPAEVPAGSTVTGVFIFTVPLEHRDQVKIGVDYTVGIPIVVFEGAAPR
jgi:hypothetical protein